MKNEREKRKQRVAAPLHKSGEYKILPEFHICWEKAWCRAQEEARSYAEIHLANLKDYCEDVADLEIPIVNERNEISIFSLGLIRLKVGKSIQAIAEAKKGLKLFHGPPWAKEVLRVHRELQSVSFERRDTGETFISYGALKVHSLLSDRQFEKMDSF